MPVRLLPATSAPPCQGMLPKSNNCLRMTSAKSLQTALQSARGRWPLESAMCFHQGGVLNTSSSRDFILLIYVSWRVRRNYAPPDKISLWAPLPNFTYNCTRAPVKFWGLRIWQGIHAPPMPLYVSPNRVATSRTPSRLSCLNEQLTNRFVFQSWDSQRATKCLRGNSQWIWTAQTNKPNTKSGPATQGLPLQTTVSRGNSLFPLNSGPLNQTGNLT